MMIKNQREWILRLESYWLVDCKTLYNKMKQIAAKITNILSDESSKENKTFLQFF